MSLERFDYLNKKPNILNSCKLVISLIAYDKLWWVAIILTGALMVNGVQYFSMLQQQTLLDELEKIKEGIKK